MFRPARPGPRHFDQRLAARAAAVFALLGLTWVFATDLLLYRLVDPAESTLLETAKGWVFVGIASLVVYLLVRRTVARVLAEEAKSRAVLDSIADGVLTLGPDGRIVDANPAAVRMLGVSGRQELIGMGAPEFSQRFRVSYPDGRLVPPEEYVSQRAVRGERPEPYKALITSASGRTLVVTVTGAPVSTEEAGRTAPAVSVMRDITHLEQLEQIRDRLFAATAHSLKTPVAIIKGHAQLLARREEPRVVASAGVIDRQCHRIDGLVQNLLVLVRLRSGSLQLHPSTVDVGRVVDDVLHKSAPSAGGHRLVPQLASHAIVRLDEERIALVLRNLIECACSRARKDADVVIKLDDDGESVRIHAHYPPRDHDARGAREPEHAELAWLEELEGHTGLSVGRHVVRKIVEAHGGRFGEEELPNDEVCEWLTVPVGVEGAGDARH